MSSWLLCQFVWSISQQSSLCLSCCESIFYASLLFLFKFLNAYLVNVDRLELLSKLDCLIEGNLLFLIFLFDSLGSGFDGLGELPESALVGIELHVLFGLDKGRNELTASFTHENSNNIPNKFKRFDVNLKSSNINNSKKDISLISRSIYQFFIIFTNDYLF